jgi:hypothetical protein
MNARKEIFLEKEELIRKEKSGQTIFLQAGCFFARSAFH